MATGVIANPVWSPDGTRLAYVALARDGFQVESVDIQQDQDGIQTFGEPRQLTTGPGVDPTSRPVYMTQEQADQVQQWLAQLPAADG